MPAITVSDLENAALDVLHIKAIATSNEPTATDRLGNTGPTISGLTAAIATSVDGVALAANLATENEIPGSVLTVQQAAALATGTTIPAIVAVVNDAAALTHTVQAATVRVRASIAAALADTTIAVGQSFTAPLMDGSLQAYVKDSEAAATAIGLPFPSSYHVNGLYDRVDRLDAVALTLVTQGVDTALAASNLSIDSTRFNAVPVTTASILNSLSVKVAVDGVFKFVVARRTFGDTFQLTEFLSTSLASATHNLTIEQFGVVDLLPGDFIGVYSVDGYCYYEDTAIGGGSYVISGFPTEPALATAAPSVRVGLNAVFAENAVQNIAAVFSGLHDRADRLDAVALTLVSQGVDTALAAGNLSINSTRFNAVPVTTASILSSLSVNVAVEGTFKFVVARRTSGDTFQLTVFLSMGLARATHNLAIEHFGIVDLLPGDFIGVYSADGYCFYEDTAIGGESYVIPGVPVTPTLATAVSSVRVGLNAVFAEKTVKNNAAALAELSATFNAVDTEFGNPVAVGSAGLISSMRATAETCPHDGILSAVNMFVTDVGDGVVTIKVLEPSDAAFMYSVVGEETFTGLVAGVNRLKTTRLLNISTGCLVAVYGKSMAVAYSVGAGHTAAIAGDVAGLVGMPVSTNKWSISAEVILPGSLRYTSEYTSRSIRNAVTPGKSKLVFDADLATGMPDYIETLGTWTKTASGQRASGAGSWTTYVRHKRDSTLDKFQFIARIKIYDITSRFALIANGLSAQGSAFEVDCTAGVLNAYAAWNSDNGNPAPVSASQAIGFTFVAGREYSAKLVKEIVASAVRYRFSLTDTVTQQTSEMTSAWFIGGSGWGKRGVAFLSGDITVKRMSYAASMPPSATLAVYGDSRTEGGGYPTNRDDRWHQLVSAAIGEDVFVSGMGGATSTQLHTRMSADFVPFAPKYTVIGIGTNDDTLTVWTSNIKRMIRIIQANGSIPVLATLPPYAAKQAFITSVNAWILASGYRYLDFGAALTTGGDRLTWNPALSSGDGVHENMAGHAAELAQIKIDLPEIFM